MITAIVGTEEFTCPHCGARYSVIFREIEPAQESDKFICFQCKQVALEWGSIGSDLRSYAAFRRLSSPTR
jgi:predicted RNA-binding Zn-ribbon protein involved in translation (DUF1610 family)